MRNAIIFLLLLSVIFFSCKSKSQLLTGSWHATKLENPDMDTFFARSQKYIDTVGKNNDAATNVVLYGVSNMDSMRHELQQQFDSAKAMQVSAVTNTVFTFRKEGVVVLSFNGTVDSSNWSLKNDTLLLTEIKQNGGKPDTIKMQLISVSSAELKLKFAEDNSYSTVTFHPDHSAQ